MTELKPGMKVRIEYETTLSRGYGSDRVQLGDLPPYDYRLDGSPLGGKNPERKDHTPPRYSYGDN